MIPHASKKAKGGEDACFINSTLLSVADGVGGWSEVGVDPALYSRGLCSAVEKIHAKHTDPYNLFVEAAAMCKHITGSTTFCITMLDQKYSRINALNFGDSGYVHFRKEGNVVVTKSQSKVMQHSFNFPFQVGSSGDDISQSWEAGFQVEAKDILILGTDGLWDNLYVEYVEKMLTSFLSVDDVIKDPNFIAQVIAKKAER